MFDDDGYLLEQYRLQVTTWSRCWRCGKAINLNHSNEVISGVHKACDTYHQALTAPEMLLIFIPQQGV